MLDRITVLHFSPTGGTRRAALLLARHIAAKVEEIDLCRPEMQAHTFGEGDVVLVAGPVYGGRLPALMTERLRACRGGGARAVSAAVYGGRAYEDALVELDDLLGGQGFRVIASAALLAEHSIVRALAAGRPDAQDEAQLAEFGARIAAKLEQGDMDAPHTPGNRPYKEWAGMPTAPQAAEACNACGACARECPAGAISPAHPAETDAARCITCMRCVTVCPQKARALPAPVLQMLSQKLAPFMEKRQENGLYI